MPDNDWGRHLEGAERERFVQISDTLKQYWLDAQCEYLASRLVDDGWSLTKIDTKENGMTGYELLERLGELGDHLLSQPVMLSVRRSEADQWPRIVHDITIGPIAGEGNAEFLGLSGFSGEFA